MNRALLFVEHIYDLIHNRWISDRAHKHWGVLIVYAFLASLAVIELQRHGLLPAPLSRIVPTNYFYAVNVAFSLLLVFEILSFIFVLSKSVADSVGKQFEILSLILLRHCFIELVHFEGPIRLSDNLGSLWSIVSNGTGALLIFVTLGFYYRAQMHRCVFSDTKEMHTFIAYKKVIAMLVMIAFIGLLIEAGMDVYSGEVPNDVFVQFYTVLIFSDILIMLVALQFQPTFFAVFRNSGFVLSTLLIRLSLTAPPYYDAAIGLGGALFALGLTVAHNTFTPDDKCLNKRA